MSKSILLKDKSDLVGVEDYIPNAYMLGAMEKSDHVPVNDIKVLSTKFSKVGKTTLEKYPNLEWVVYRGHGTDHINLDLCRKHNVGVIPTKPSAETESCAQWMKDKLVDGTTLIFGNGAISKKLQELIVGDYEFDVLDSSDKINKISELSRGGEYQNIVACVPLNKSTENMFNYDLFSSTKCRIFVSISRARCHDNESLLRLVNEGKVQEMHIDILGTDNRQELIDTGKIHYYKHTSWKYIENKNPHDHTELKDIIDSCLRDDVKNPVLSRRKSKWF